jgi:hypothetical protein
MRVFELALKGFNELEEDRQRAEWERLRVLGAWVIAPYSKVSMTPKKLLPLPWDVQESSEEWKKRNKKILDECDIIFKKSEQHN